MIDVSTEAIEPKRVYLVLFAFQLLAGYLDRGESRSHLVHPRITTPFAEGSPLSPRCSSAEHFVVPALRFPFFAPNQVRLLARSERRSLRFATHGRWQEQGISNLLRGALRAKDTPATACSCLVQFRRERGRPFQPHQRRFAPGKTNGKISGSSKVRRGFYQALRSDGAETQSFVLVDSSAKCQETFPLLVVLLSACVTVYCVVCIPAWRA